MLDELFTALYQAMTQSVWLAVAASFAWGVLSIILSPCHLSSIPLVIGYITSRGRMKTKRVFVIALVFSLGILITIAAIGLITASLGRLMGDVGEYGNYFVALIFFLTGLYLLDIISVNFNTIGFSKTKTEGLLAPLLLGLIFGIALGPCTFAYMAPVLSIVFQTAQTEYLTSILLLAAFATGHCAVIAGAGTLAGKVQSYMNWAEGSNVILWIKRICGILVILGGVYLIYTS